MTVYREIDWSERPAEDYVRAVYLALNSGAHLVARNLAMQGAERYPADAELQKMAYVLAPPKVTVSKLPPKPGIRADRDWLQANWDTYKGKWVALRNGELLGVADSLDDLLKEVGEIENTGILVTQLW